MLGGSTQGGQAKQTVAPIGKRASSAGGKAADKAPSQSTCLLSNAFTGIIEEDSSLNQRAVSIEVREILSMIINLLYPHFFASGACIDLVVLS